MSLQQLSEKYLRCLEKYYGEVYRDFATLDLKEVAKLSDEISVLEREIYALSVISKNEEIDDLSTEEIKYILLPYIKAETFRVIKDSKVSQDRFARESDLFEVKKLYLEFLNDTLEIRNSIPKGAIELVGDSQLKDYLEDCCDGAKKSKIKIDRQSKIMRFKKIKELKSSLSQFFNSGFNFPEESENREMYLKTIELFFLEACSQISIIDNELQVLEFFTKGNGEKALENKTFSKPKSLPESNHIPKLDAHYIAPNIRLLSTKENLQSCLKFKNVKDTSIYNIRQTFQSKVFGPSHTLPTITIAEAAEMELAQALEQEKSAEIFKKEKEERDQILHDKEYCKEEEEDELKGRSWDDWKDFNPKGHGNTIRNRG
ncbi:type 2A phosphatase-associated protein 42, putative (TAP42) [Cryptosporidium felis]|nr:type 2A phosphatase-associated protein 42, putative (TAP42) [Cryptosporidium felis]